jgi:hypothetical protein
MRKSRKVVPITLKRKPSTTLEVPVQVEGATRILTCHRTPAQITFSLGPPLASGEAPLLPKPSKGTSLSFLVARPTQRTSKVTHPSRYERTSEPNPAQQDRDAQRYPLLSDYLLRNGFVRQVALSIEDSEPFVMAAGSMARPSSRPSTRWSPDRNGS